MFPMAVVSWTEIVVVVVILLLFFGASRLPSIARSLGKSAKEFKKGVKEGEGEDAEPGDGKQKPEDGQKPK